MKFLSVLFLLALVSCKTPCTQDQVLTNGLAKGVATALQCQNLPQIQTDVVNMLAKANVCSATSGNLKAGPITAIVCPIVATAAVDLLGTAVPPSWQCDPAYAKSGVSVAISAACQLLPF